jgi:drug/metabolite transporter (DMT)-like permease
VFGAIFLDETVTAWLVLGVVLVVGGIVLAQRGLPDRSSVRVRAWRSAPSRSSGTKLR